MTRTLELPDALADALAEQAAAEDTPVDQLILHDRIAALVAAGRRSEAAALAAKFVAEFDAHINTGFQQAQAS